MCRACRTTPPDGPPEFLADILESCKQGRLRGPMRWQKPPPKLVWRPKPQPKMRKVKTFSELSEKELWAYLNAQTRRWRAGKAVAPVPWRWVGNL